MRPLLADLIARYQRMSSSQRKVWLAAGSGALAVLLVACSLLAIGMSAPPSRTTAHASDPASPTHIATFTATATVTPRPTNTVVVARPAPPATKISAPLPPPPPFPTPPPDTPTATPCPTATPVPPTPTPMPTATGAAGPTPTATPVPQPPTGTACQPCPVYAGNNPSQSQIAAALDSAADTYHLPRNLLRAIAWQESKWHEDVTSCDGGVGLMQIQYNNVSFFNSMAPSQCGLTPTNYDVSTVQGNALLGAKFLAWLSCYFAYWGNETPPSNPCGSGTSISDPAPYTSACYYKQAGLQYPDTKNADGSANPNSLCAAVFNDPNHPEYADLPSTTAQPWSCPYSATAGDATLLDLTVSAYNEGPRAISTCGICNPGYVANVEAFIPQFASGALP